jgi:hypothetical protein
MIDLSIIVPSIRPNSIGRLLDSIPNSIGDYEYEIIIVGPYEPEFACRYINDFGSPSRGVQRGSTIADGKFMKWSTDDGIYRSGALKRAMDVAVDMDDKDGVIMKYTEDGPANWVTGADDIYYTAWTHDSNKLSGIPKDYKIAPVGLYNTNFFRMMGGLDCSFEHINMNTHDLAFRVQRNGGVMHFSPDVIMHCDSKNQSSEHAVLNDSYKSNDLPKFLELYGGKDIIGDRIHIDYDNWKESPAIWRRFK